MGWLGGGASVWRISGCAADVPNIPSSSADGTDLPSTCVCVNFERHVRRAVEVHLPTWCACELRASASSPKCACGLRASSPKWDKPCSRGRWKVQWSSNISGRHDRSKHCRRSPACIHQEVLEEILQEEDELQEEGKRRLLLSRIRYKQ